MWIEIINSRPTCWDNRSRPARALWIEMFTICKIKIATGSRPARALWIEIVWLRRIIYTFCVEAREGLVD